MFLRTELRGGKDFTKKICNVLKLILTYRRKKKGTGIVAKTATASAKSKRPGHDSEKLKRSS